MLSRPPGPNDHRRVLSAITGDHSLIWRMNRRTGWPPGFAGCVGKVNPSRAVIWIVPSVIGRALLATSNVVFTPLNVKVATLSPEPMTSLSVFSPLHATVDRQLNKALVEMVA